MYACTCILLLPSSKCSRVTLSFMHTNAIFFFEMMRPHFRSQKVVSLLTMLWSNWPLPWSLLHEFISCSLLEKPFQECGLKLFTPCVAYLFVSLVFHHTELLIIFHLWFSKCQKYWKCQAINFALSFHCDNCGWTLLKSNSIQCSHRSIFNSHSPAVLHNIQWSKLLD